MSEKIYETRDIISEFLGFYDSTRVIFTHNATHALNIAIKGEVTSPMHVIISDIEHNSVLRPLTKAINRFGGEISVFNTDLSIDEAIRPIIRDDTKLIISSIASNVTGKTVDCVRLCEIAKERNIKVILDASQFLGHKPFNYKEAPADYVIASGHKSLFGLQGAGILLLGKGANPDTIIEGGNGYDTSNRSMGDLIPEKYEAGTVAGPSIIALGSGVKYITGVTIGEIDEKINLLTEKIMTVLASFQNIKVYGSGCGIIPFNFASTPSYIVSEALNKHSITTRSGLHCSPLIHDKLGTVETGIVRLSLSYLNKFGEIDRFYKALKDINQVI